MTELIKCSGCASRKLPEFYTIKPTTGQRLKTCNDCRERLKLRPKPSPKSNSSSEFCCNQCQKKLSSNQRLLLHIKSVHDKIQDFACIHCEQKFSERGNLQLHVKAVHDKIRDHQCTQCDVQFSYRWLLDLHIKSIHDQIRDEECPTCDFKYRQPEKAFKSMHRWIKHVIRRICRERRPGGHEDPVSSRNAVFRLPRPRDVAF